MSKEKGRYIFGHIQYGFDSFGSLVHPPVQSYILIDRFWWRSMLVVLVCISLREFGLCHPFTFMLDDYHWE